MLYWVLSLFVFNQLYHDAAPRNIQTNEINFWNSIARKNVDKKLQMNPHLLKGKRPKNIILFIGDGMGISTVTSARVNKNQHAGNPHVNAPLFFEGFAHAGLVKTSSFDHHVTDSAAGATALLTGRKTNSKMLGTMPNTKATCTNATESHIVDGIVEGALQKGVAVGFVTTTRVTHATPAALYAKVMMGGGRAYLMDETRHGLRRDGANIDLEWLSLEGKRRVLRTRNDLDAADGLDQEEKLLGVFSEQHLPYYLNQLVDGQQTAPRLHEMTQKAIRHLQKDNDGFFLVVEGGLIDMAEHINQMHLAFAEMYEFEEAIRTAREMTNLNDTLIIVTADHGHALTLPGYVPKTDSIFESFKISEGGANVAEYYVPTMFFATGPGYANGFQMHDGVATGQPLYRQRSAIPTKYGFHGGEDVGIWADGPFSELFSSTIENTEVAYLMKFLLCAGTADYSICDVDKSLYEVSTSNPLHLNEFERGVMERFGVTTLTIAAVTLLVISVLSLLVIFFLASLLYVQNKMISSSNYKANHSQRLF
ncbi:unnamed protein product [Nippostrongylus brasiliensis]|uniref:Alkaline phosphatase n=1 Tax=Nippostrongylus brasiliensis TaxID=27835 RepID=A0A158QWG7_NIPBR|nr:unnamed protein product [Nippostrongylus brasiliensis]